MMNIKSFLPLLLLLATGSSHIYHTTAEDTSGAPQPTAAATTPAATTDKKVPAASSQATPAPRSWAELRGWLWADTKTMFVMVPLAPFLAVFFGQFLVVSMKIPANNPPKGALASKLIGVALFITFITWGCFL